MQQTSPPTNPVQVSMSLEEALDVVWTPNRHFKPIRELLETKTVTERDLAWAAFIADTINPRIRDAARAILAHKLMLPTIQASSMDKGPQVVTGSDYVRVNERWSLGEFSFILGFIAASILWIVITFAQEWGKGTLTIPVLLVFVVLLFVTARLANSESRRAYREYQAYKKGREGEDRIAERAVAILDGNWTIFRNFVLPDRKDDIDLLLVGPGGVWALEVKTYSAGTKLAAPASKRRGWPSTPSLAPLTPDVQATVNAARVKQLLAQRHCDVHWVQAVLIFAEYQPADFATESDKLEVWTSTEADDRLVQLRSLNRLAEQQVEKLVTELKAIQSTAK